MTNEFEIREEERAKFARYLHDVLASELLHFQYSFLKIEKEIEPSVFSNLSNQLENIRNQVRNFSHTLILPNLNNHQSVKEAVSDLLIDYTYLFDNIAFELLFFPRKEDILLSDDKLKELIIILKELLHNAIQHGDSTEIEVNITAYDDLLSIVIDDNGKGFDVTHKKKGIGLKNMKQRVQKLGGTFIVDSNKSTGTTITFEIKK